MSAAEKLKAIEAGCASWDDGERWADGLEIYIYNGQPPIHLLRNALPQIVAVIEAAEDFPEIFVVEGRSHSFVPLLDALEEAAENFGGEWDAMTRGDHKRLERLETSVAALDEALG